MTVVKANWPPIKIDSFTICGKCGGNCSPSKAHLNAKAYSQPNMLGNRTIYNGPAILVDCMKCDTCGHSFVPETASIEIPSNGWTKESPNLQNLNQ